MGTAGGALRRTAWLGPGTLVVLLACAGDPFVFGGDAGSDALMDTPAKTLDVPCGPQPTCSRGDVPPKSCCASLTANSERCTGGSCSCDTQLECASDANCPGLKPFCCIGSMTSASCTTATNPMNLVFDAHCSLPSDCVDPVAHMCNPASSEVQCIPPRTCMGDANTLQKYLLPPDQGYGVCSQ